MKNAVTFSAMRPYISWKQKQKIVFDQVFDSRLVYFHAESYLTTLASKGKFMTRGGWRYWEGAPKICILQNQQEGGGGLLKFQCLHPPLSYYMNFPQVVGLSVKRLTRHVSFIYISLPPYSLISVSQWDLCYIVGKCHYLSPGYLVFLNEVY